MDRETYTRNQAVHGWGHPLDPTPLFPVYPSADCTMGRLLKTFLPLLGLLLAVGVIVLLHQELRHYDYHSVVLNLRTIPWQKIAWAALLTAVSYFLLILYDALALRQLGRSPGFLRTAFASFTAYVLSYNIGLSVISGTAVRLRLYSAWNYTTGEIGRIVTFTGLTFWVGLLAASGTLLMAGGIHPWPGLPGLSPHFREVGAVFLLVVSAYVAACLWRRRPVTIRGWTFPLPRWPTALLQIFLGGIDVVVAGLVAWVLMPDGWPLENFLPVYLLGMTLGILSHVPGGLGVLETTLLYGRPETLPGPGVLGALLVFRVVYYLMPLGVALLLLAGHEAARHRRHVERAAVFTSRWAARLAPHLFAATAFFAGIVLLASGSTPAVHTRLAWLQKLVPLPVLEISHLLGSVVGVLLLFVARGLQRRLDGAYFVTLFLLGAGAVFSLLKGVDWEEAFILLVIFWLLLPCRDFFHRRASLLDARFTPGWVVAIVLVLGATLWLGFFAYRHVEYSHELWWRFALRSDAPRFLRASVAMFAVALVLGVRHLIHPATARPDLPDAAALERAAGIVTASSDTLGHLALTGDKALLFSETGGSFIMYGVERRSWIAMGDPIGPRPEWEDLVWSFRERCDHYGGWAAFYEVSVDDLPLYLDLGLTLTKLGEEARVPLSGFSIERSEFKGLRKTLHRAELEGLSFEWIEAGSVAPVLPDLRRVSAAWLASRSLREKGFSLGFFRDDYLLRNPVVVARTVGEIVAFANVWETADRCELSMDLMRYSDHAPSGTMEFLLTQLMLRGAREGYQWFNLGMAPLSGMENRPLAPLQQRIAALVYQHGERFYHFQGLRAFKEKYHPVWSPRYLASPGGLALPIILAHVTALISGSPKNSAVK